MRCLKCLGDKRSLLQFVSVLPCQLVLEYYCFYELRKLDIQPVQRRVQLLVVRVEKHYYIFD